MQAKTETQPALHPAICDTHLTRSRKSARLELAGLKRLVLTGFMGAGKSTVGRLLAERLGWEFLDLDVLVESRSGLTVPEIFSTHGEAHFRRLESQELAAALGRGNIVLALGGGAPESLTNRLLLEQTPATAIEPGAVRTQHGTVRADFVIRATEGYSVSLAEHRRAVAPVWSLLVVTEPLPAHVWAEIGWDNRDTVTDERHVLIYAQRTADGRIETVRIVPEGSAVANYAFDVTPARLVTGLITERGLLQATREGLAAAFPERAGGKR